MKKVFRLSLLLMICCTLVLPAYANLINANTSNYTTYLNSLVANDTLKLAPGIYTNHLTLNGINGNAGTPIVIMGSGLSTVFQGNACCNTVSITQCSYLTIRDLKLDGLNLNIDAVKAEGTSGNWAHHITLEYLNIVNYGSSQQNVGISTKCAAWDWIIRKNKIIGAGTGMYLGNSTGEAPFVNGLIEYNFIANTIGYNIEIKHQLDIVRALFAGTAVNGKTTIRHNVFTKDTTSSTGANARPNVLVGGFPLNGFGSTDYYEIYGNFFYNNPVEALFQGTGNINLYNNIFVNHFDPAGFRAIYLTPHNGVSPQNIQVFHNTVWAKNTSGGIRLYNPNNAYQQYCYSNAVFSPQAISNFTNSVDNVTDSYVNAGNYVLAANANINALNLYPQSGQLLSTLTPFTLFMNNIDWSKDFNHGIYDWSYRGAYSGCCVNNGWTLQLDTMSSTPGIANTLLPIQATQTFTLFPNPVENYLHIEHSFAIPTSLTVTDLMGRTLKTQYINKYFKLDMSSMPKGIYLIHLKNSQGYSTQKIIKE